MSRRLSVLAGSGALVSHVVAAAMAAGDAVQVVGFAPQPERAGVLLVGGDLRNPTGAIAAIVAFKATHVVLAGGLMISDGDREALARFAGGGHGAAQGDAALSSVTAAIEKFSGAKVIGVHEVAADLLAPIGQVAGRSPTAAELAAARQGLVAAREIGRLDLGQAVVVAGRRVVAAEDVGGTDELLERVAAHRAAGRIGDGAGPLVLVKAAKPQQPLHVDLPAIGPDTLSGAVAAGISAIAVEAARSLILARSELVAAADRYGIAVIGLGADG
ncbi:UDP-2,3-diacylglucosamine diphosphatase LpxI domain-containing protein [Devosia sp. A16]|uniref:UDP-2,3-diacylglucosamine diphosphatase LpxI domain-containing protein n=1 Tax=Devosia sp. A16 TaxID=1736675 RepID=UPI000ACF6F1F|nr:UDP-2,3-diacylglucosamine diphosphatase LpxI [Devosia sp. A16]